MTKIKIGVYARDYFLHPATEHSWALIHKEDMADYIKGDTTKAVYATDVMDLYVHLNKKYKQVIG